MRDKGYIKIEAEATINKNGQIVGWKDLESGPDAEYWSEASLSSIEENNEERARLFTKLGGAALRIGPIEPNKYYPYSEDTSNLQKGDKVRGFKFVPYDRNEEKKLEELNSAFLSKIAVADELRIRGNKSFNYRAKVPKSFDEQKDAARFYIGPLDYREATDYDGRFGDPGKGRYEEKHERVVRKCKGAFLSQDRNDENIEDKIAGRMLEAFFHPLIRSGFFDSPDGEPAAVILTSDYDDFVNKADSALFIPVEGLDEDGNMRIVHQPICLDLTIGTGKGKVGKIHENYDKRHGFTDIIYPSTCSGDALPEMKDVPHFTLCLPRDKSEFSSFCESQASGKLPPKEIGNLIYYELFRQAEQWAAYYSRLDGDDNKRKANIYINLSRYFQKKLGIIGKKPNSGTRLDILDQRHPGALRFIHSYRAK